MKKIITLLAVGAIAVPAFAAPKGEKDAGEAKAKSEVKVKSPSASNPYELAERFTAPKLQNMLFSTVADPVWFPTGDKFWYSYKTSDGTHYYVVDPAARSRRELFDNDRLASQLTEIVRDPFVGDHLPIRNLEVGQDGRTFTFEVVSTLDAKPYTDENGKEVKPKKGEKQIFFFSYDYPTGRLTYLKDQKKRVVKQLPWASVSPDGKTVVYAKDFNLYRMSREDYEKLKKNENDSTVTDIALTTDGVKDFGYGQPYSYLNTDTLANGKRKAVQNVLWSPDSKHLVSVVTDSRPVKELWVINSMASPRPTLETYKYEMPGDSIIPQDHLFVFDMADNSRKEIKTHRFKDQTLELGFKPREQRQRQMYDQPWMWLGDNGKFYLNRSSRDLYRIDVCSYTIGQDSIVPLIEERLNTYQNTRPLALANGGKEMIEWSERDGWAHLYLYDDKGNLKRKLTEGPWHVHNILKVDDRTRRVYFTGMGREEGEHPYYQQLYSVSLDGGPVKRLTKGEAFHTPVIDDQARFFVDNFSRVDTIPETALFTTDGAKVIDLEKSDFSQLFANGYKFPEVFKVKAADGVTDLWGVMYKPYDFDPEKSYPIVDYVYPGPQVEAVYYPYTRMSVRTDRLAQMGMIVISVGNRGGHPDRSKWYHNYGYGNLRDYGLADQKAAIEQLAARHPWIDINRVGIHGHSGGGFMSTAAILQYPDFFKAAVSCAGNHDNRIYNRWWSETHHGVKETVGEKGDTTFVYQIKTNPEIASRLKGQLMLVHGDIDNNVHPGNSLRVVDALIRANKRFDMLILPQQRHGFGDMNEYFYWRLADFFKDYLVDGKQRQVDIPAR